MAEKYPLLGRAIEQLSESYIYTIDRCFTTLLDIFIVITFASSPSIICSPHFTKGNYLDNQENALPDNPSLVCFSMDHYERASKGQRDLRQHHLIQ